MVFHFTCQNCSAVSGTQGMLRPTLIAITKMVLNYTSDLKNT